MMLNSGSSLPKREMSLHQQFGQANLHSSIGKASMAVAHVPFDVCNNLVIVEHS